MNDDPIEKHQSSDPYQRDTGGSPAGSTQH